MLLLATTLLVGCGGVKEGAQAPEFLLKDTNGKLVTLSQFEGKPVVLSFMASWCPPCQMEMPRLQSDVYAPLRDRGLVVLAVASNEPPEKAESVRSRHKLEFPVMADPDGIATSEFKVSAYPTLFVLDASHKIRLRKQGFNPATFQEEVVQLATSLLP